MIHGDRGHGGRSWRAGRQLHDVGGKTQLGCTGSPPRKRRNRVAPPRLGGEHCLVAQALNHLECFRNTSGHRTTPISDVPAEFEIIRHRYFTVVGNDISACLLLET